MDDTWQNTGDWADDNAHGVELGRECVAQIRDGVAPSYLGHLVKAMIERRQFGGVEVGFFHALSEAVRE